MNYRHHVVESIELRASGECVAHVQILGVSFSFRYADTDVGRIIAELAEDGYDISTCQQIIAS